MTHRLLIILATFTLAAFAAPKQKPHVVFLAGDDEYRSEYTLPALGRILEKEYGCKVSVAYARPRPQDTKNMEGLEALATADLAVFFLRWRELPDDQIAMIMNYAGSHRPLVGFRTATHSFKYPAGSPHEQLNDDFPIDTFGTKWFRHHGHLSTTVTSLAPKAGDHPILQGVNPVMMLPSWLYVVEMHGDVNPLLIGKAINPQNGKDYGPQPVAWTKSHEGARVFFTTLGHPDDFKNESFRRLAVNGILWALGKDVPKKGAKVEVPGGFNPPSSGFAK